MFVEQEESVVKFFALFGASVVLAGCVNPQVFETEPVTLKTPKGAVTCQLYTPDQVAWDRAIAWPKGLSAKKADKICREEGERRLR